MLNFNKKIPFAFLLFCISPNCCFSYNSQLKDEIIAYDKGNYSEVIRIGEDLIPLNKGDADLVHYYLANAYFQLKLEEKARQEYSICLKETKNVQILTYSKAALSILDSHYSSDGAGKTLSRPYGIKEVNDRIKELKKSLEDEEQVKLSNLTKEIDFKIKQINDQSQSEIDLVPKSDEDAVDRSPIYSASEEAQVDAIKEDTKNKIYAINEEYTSRRHAIIASYKIKAANLNTSFDHMISASKPGLTDVQLLPQRSNLYVRNYINYIEDIPVPPVIEGLKAIQKSLDLSKVQDSIDKTRHK